MLVRTVAEAGTCTGPLCTELTEHGAYDLLFDVALWLHALAAAERQLSLELKQKEKERAAGAAAAEELEQARLREAEQQAKEAAEAEAKIASAMGPLFSSPTAHVRVFSPSNAFRFGTPQPLSRSLVFASPAAATRSLAAASAFAAASASAAATAGSASTAPAESKAPSATSASVLAQQHAAQAAESAAGSLGGECEAHLTRFLQTLYELIFVGPEALPLVPGQHTMPQREIDDLEIPRECSCSAVLCALRPYGC